MRDALLPSTSFELPVRVYYEDTDAAGVVYYANYLKFCERARTEWLRELGFSQEAMRSLNDTVFVVRAVSAEYLVPAVLDDALLVVSSVEKLGRASIVFRQRVTREGRDLCDVRVTVACLDLVRGRAAPFPVAVRASFQNYLSASV